MDEKEGKKKISGIQVFLMFFITLVLFNGFYLALRDTAKDEIPSIYNALFKSEDEYGDSRKYFDKAEREFSKNLDYKKALEISKQYKNVNVYKLSFLDIDKDSDDNSAYFGYLKNKQQISKKNIPFMDSVTDDDFFLVPSHGKEKVDYYKQVVDSKTKVSYVVAYTGIKWGAASKNKIQRCYIIHRLPEYSYNK